MDISKTYSFNWVEYSVAFFGSPHTFLTKKVQMALHFILQ